MTSRVRALALLGAWLSLAAHLAGIAHQVGVRHATCPTHGELIHDDPRAGSAAPAGAEAAAPVVAATWNAPPAAAAGAEDHCLALLTRRRELVALPATAPAPLFPPAAHVAPTAAPALAGLAAFPLYRLAPKTPPPARASA